MSVLSSSQIAWEGWKVWQRRLAIQIASQLPEDIDEAHEVLDLARGLVNNFLVDTSRAAKVIALFPSAIPETTHDYPIRRLYRLVIGVLVGAAAMAISPTSESDAGATIKSLHAALESREIRPGEPLRVVITTYRTANCGGTIYQVVYNELGQEAWKDAVPAENHPVGTLETHTFTVKLPVLAPGLYVFGSKSHQSSCPGAPRTVHIPPLTFWVID